MSKHLLTKHAKQAMNVMCVCINESGTHVRFDPTFKLLTGNLH